MKEPSSGIPLNQEGYPVNFNFPVNGPDQGGSRVFNPLEELASSRFKVSFEDSGDSYDYGVSYYGDWWDQEVIESADDSEFIETVQYFQYTGSDGKGYFIMPTDGRQMLLMSATESLYHESLAGIYRELGKEFTGGTLSFDWYFISDMTPEADEYFNLAQGAAEFGLGGEWQARHSGVLAFEEMGYFDEPVGVVSGSSSGWQTQVIHLDQDTTYDSLEFVLGVFKEEDEFEGVGGDTGDVYLLVDNIQLNGLNDMMQFGQVENALWNESEWFGGIFI